MPIIQHKFGNHQVSPDTTILMLGTFNPDIPAGPTFFYGRPRNYLWQLLPGCYDLPSLKDSPFADKQAFMIAHHIDFADLIHSVNVPAGEEANIDDIFIDPLIHQWKDIIGVINGLHQLQAVYFTRKTFDGIPNIHARIIAISNHCAENNIRFCLLETPARYVSASKQQQWINTIVHQNLCLG